MGPRIPQKKNEVQNGPRNQSQNATKGRSHRENAPAPVSRAYPKWTSEHRKTIKRVPKTVPTLRLLRSLPFLHHCLARTAIGGVALFQGIGKELLVKALKIRGMIPAANLPKVTAATAAMAGIIAVASAGALAGTDTTFGSIATSLTGWLEGSLGTTLAVISLIFGVGSAVINFNWKVLAASVGVALAATTGPGIVSGMVSAIV